MALVRVNQLLVRHVAGTPFVNGVVRRLRLRAVATVVSTSRAVAVAGATMAAVAALNPHPTLARAAFAERMHCVASLTAAGGAITDFTIRALGPHYLIAQAEMESNPLTSGEVEQTWMVGVARCIGVSRVRNDTAGAAVAEAECEAVLAPAGTATYIIGRAQVRAVLPPPRAPWMVMFGFAEFGGGNAIFTTPRARSILARAYCIGQGARHVNHAVPEEPIEVEGFIGLVKPLSISGQMRAFTVRAEADVYGWATTDGPPLPPGVKARLTGWAAVVNPIIAAISRPLAGQIQVEGDLTVKAAPTVRTPKADITAFARILQARPKDPIVTKVQRFEAIANADADAVELVEPGARWKVSAELDAPGGGTFMAFNTPYTYCFRVVVGTYSEPIYGAGPGGANTLIGYRTVKLTEQRCVTARMTYTGFAVAGRLKNQPGLYLPPPDTEIDKDGPFPFDVVLPESDPWGPAVLVTPSTTLTATAAVSATPGDTILVSGANIRGQARVGTPGHVVGMFGWILAKAEIAFSGMVTLRASNNGLVQVEPQKVWELQSIPWDEWEEPWGADDSPVPMPGFIGRAVLLMPRRAGANLTVAAQFTAYTSPTGKISAAASAAGAARLRLPPAAATITAAANTKGSLMSPQTFVLTDVTAPVVDKSMYGHTVNGNALSSTSGRFGSAWQFIGSRAAWVNDLDLSDHTQVKVEMFVRNMSGLRTIFRLGDLRVDTDLALMVGSDIDVAPAPLPLGVWTFVTVTHDGTTAKLYTGTTQVASVVAPLNLAAINRLILGNSTSVGVSETGNTLIDTLRLRVDDLTVAVPTSEFGM